MKIRQCAVPAENMTTHTQNPHANKRTFRALLKTAVLNLFRVTEDGKVALSNELTARTLENSDAPYPSLFTQTYM